MNVSVISANCDGPIASTRFNARCNLVGSRQYHHCHGPTNDNARAPCTQQLVLCPASMPVDEPARMLDAGETVYVAGGLEPNRMAYVLERPTHSDPVRAVLCLLDLGPSEILPRWRLIGDGLRPLTIDDKGGRYLSLELAGGRAGGIGWTTRQRGIDRSDLLEWDGHSLRRMQEGAPAY